MKTSSTRQMPSRFPSRSNRLRGHEGRRRYEKTKGVTTGGVRTRGVGPHRKHNGSPRKIQGERGIRYRHQRWGPQKGPRVGIGGRGATGRYTNKAGIDGRIPQNEANAMTSIW